MFIRMSLRKSFFSFAVVYLSLLQLAICKPSPQGTTSDVLQDSRDIDIKEDNINTEVNKKEEDENNDVGTAVADIFGDVLDLFNGALVTAEEIAGNEDVQEAVSNIVDVSLQSGAQAASTGAQLAQAAPEHFAEKGNFAAGLTKTVEETGGLLGGSIDELEQGAKLFSVFAQAYTDITLKRIENFSKTFNKRFKCNTDCRKLKDCTPEKLQCEKDYCEGFVKSKTKEQQEEEELKKLAEQYDYDYSDDEEEEDS